MRFTLLTRRRRVQPVAAPLRALHRRFGAAQHRVGGSSVIGPEHRVDRQLHCKGHAGDHCGAASDRRRLSARTSTSRSVAHSAQDDRELVGAGCERRRPHPAAPRSAAVRPPTGSTRGPDGHPRRRSGARPAAVRARPSCAVGKATAVGGRPRATPDTIEATAEATAAGVARHAAAWPGRTGATPAPVRHGRDVASTRASGRQHPPREQDDEGQAVVDELPPAPTRRSSARRRSP